MKALFLSGLAGLAACAGTALGQVAIEGDADLPPARGDVEARAFVAGALVAEARIKFMMVDAEQE